MLLRWALSVIVNSVALITVGQLFDDFYLENFETALIASLILSILNVFIKPLLILFTLPITVFTLGLFLFVINAITLMITQSLMGPSFEIQYFSTAIVASIVISFLTLILNRVIRTTVRY